MFYCHHPHGDAHAERRLPPRNILEITSKPHPSKRPSRQTEGTVDVARPRAKRLRERKNSKNRKIAYTKASARGQSAASHGQARPKHDPKGTNNIQKPLRPDPV